MAGDRKNSRKAHDPKLLVIHLLGHTNIFLQISCAINALTQPSHDHVLLKHALTLSSVKKLHTCTHASIPSNLPVMDNDAKSCFDRIITALAMIISGYFGMPLEARKTQAKTLKRFTFNFGPPWVNQNDPTH
jgi:hypothetical protein